MPPLALLGFLSFRFLVAKARFISGFLPPCWIKSAPGQNVKSDRVSWQDVSETCTPRITLSAYCAYSFVLPGWPKQSKPE